MIVVNTSQKKHRKRGIHTQKSSQQEILKLFQFDDNDEKSKQQTQNKINKKTKSQKKIKKGKQIDSFEHTVSLQKPLLPKQSEQFQKTLTFKKKKEQRTQRNSNENMKKGKKPKEKIKDKQVYSSYSLDLNKRKIIEIPKCEQYLILGDSYYPIEQNNFCPSKRVLQTFRQACLDMQNNGSSKYLTQSREKFENKNCQKKTNIFQQAKKQIQSKIRNKKALIIQKWWKRVKPQSKPKIIQSKMMVIDVSRQESRVLFDLESQLEIDRNLQQKLFNAKKTVLKNLFNQNQITRQVYQTKCKQLDFFSFEQPSGISIDKSQTNLKSQITKNIPKRIQMHQQICLDLQSYKLPDLSVGVEQNEKILNNYIQFKIKQNLNSSDNSLEEIQNLGSPIKSDSSSSQSDNQFQSNDKSLFNSISPQYCKRIQQATKIKQKIQMRLFNQTSHTDTELSITKIGINTNLVSIHKFLSNFFNYYIINYKQQFLRFINMPVGMDVQTRLKTLQGTPSPSEPYEDEEQVVYNLKEIIDIQKIDEYFEYLKTKKQSMIQNTNLELLKIHSQAVIDLFNQELNCYRPYNAIDGVPYPWNNCWKALTFYFVHQENVIEVFQKCELSILKCCSNLCGVIIDDQFRSQQILKEEKQKKENLNIMEKYQRTYHPFVQESNELKLNKMFSDIIKETVFEPNTQTITELYFDISQEVFLTLLTEQIKVISEMFQNV